MTFNPLQQVRRILEERLRTEPELWPGFSAEVVDCWQEWVKSLADNARARGIDERSLLKLLRQIGDPTAVMKGSLRTLEQLALPESDDEPSTVKPPDLPGAWRNGDRLYQVGNDAPLMIGEAQDQVLCALIDLGGAAEKPQLVEHTGREHAPRILQSICSQFTMLAPYIVARPGRKSRGGYRTTIRRRPS